MVLWPVKFFNTSNPVRNSVSNVEFEYSSEDESDVIYTGTVEIDDDLSPLGSPTSSPQIASTSGTEQPRRKRAKQNKEAVALIDKATSLLEETNKEQAHELSKFDVIDSFLL